jgi:hypothetical protein
MVLDIPLWKSVYENLKLSSNPCKCKSLTLNVYVYTYPPCKFVQIYVKCAEKEKFVQKIVNMGANE